MTLTPPPKIEDIGLRTYLNTNYGVQGGYNEFIKRLVELNEPKSVIANAFGVERRTIYRWLEIYNKENK